MKKLLIISFAFISPIIIKTQTGTAPSCRFELKADKEILEKYYPVSRYSFRPLSKNLADKIGMKLRLSRYESLYVQKDSLCNRFKDIVVYKNLYLNSIELELDSMPYNMVGLLIRCTFQQIKKD